MAEKETHDQNQAAVDLKRLEVLGKVYSLLNKPIQKSAVLTFEPISFKQVHRIVDIASYKIIDSHNRSMPMIAAMEKIGKHHQSERVNTATFKNRLSAQAEMDDHDQSSFFVPDVDIGTNILFTYFLHAVEIERLVRINQELAKDCKELDEEAGTLQSKTDSLEAALKKSEDDRAVVSGRYATLQANYANQTQLEQELREEIRKLQGAIANNKMAHEKEIAELKKASVVQAKEHGASGNRKTSEYRSEEETAPQNNQKRDQQKQNPDELTRLISQNEALKADIRKLKDQSAPSPDPVSHKDSFLSKLRAIDQGIHKSERLIKEYSSSRAPPPASSAEVPPSQKISQLIMGGTGDKKGRTATVPAGDCAEDGFVERQMFAHHFTIDKAVLRHDYDRRPVAGPPVQLYPAPLDSGRAGAKQPGSRQPFEAPGPKSERNCSAKSAAGETNPYQRQAFLPGLSTDRERLSTQEAGQAVYRPILHSSSKKKASKPQSVATGLHCDSSFRITRRRQRY